MDDKWPFFTAWEIRPFMADRAMGLGLWPGREWFIGIPVSGNSRKKPECSDKPTQLLEETMRTGQRGEHQGPAI